MKLLIATLFFLIFILGCPSPELTFTTSTVNAEDSVNTEEPDDPANTMTAEEADKDTLNKTLGKPAGPAEIQMANFIAGICKQPDQTIEELKHCMEKVTICNAEAVTGSIYDILACAEEALR